jgi:hypothetical protein
MRPGGFSTAVVARRSEPADSLDYFPTPPWATRAFCEHVLLPLAGPDVFKGDAIDPACGEGHMALALRDYFNLVTASDIHPYGFGGVNDFLHPGAIYAPRDWVITNPPFNAAAEFIHRALTIARVGVAMLVRTQFQEGQERYRAIFARRPPVVIAQYAERVPMHRGRWVVNGKTATAYQWMVWLREPHHGDPCFRWIPPCQAQMSRHDDWLRFGGCIDLPKKHPALKLMDGGKSAELEEAADLFEEAA